MPRPASPQLRLIVGSRPRGRHPATDTGARRQTTHLLLLLATVGGLALVARDDARGRICAWDAVGVALCTLGVGGGPIARRRNTRCR